MPTAAGDEIAMVVAIANNNVIGHNGRLPWSLPADLKFFRDLTRDHVVIMGRKTFESIGKPLDRRVNIVLTRDATWQREGVLIATSFDQALALGPIGKRRFIIGGADIYTHAWERIDSAFVTRIHADFPGETRLHLDFSTLRLASTQLREADERNLCPMTFERYGRDVHVQGSGHSTSLNIPQQGHP